MTINKYFSFIFILIISSLLNKTLINNNVLKNLIYIIEAIFIIICYRDIIKKNILTYKEKYNIYIIILLLFFSCIFTGGFANWLKYVGYIFMFYMGKKYSNKSLHIHRNIVFSIVFIPLLLVAAFDHSITKGFFFPRSNTFVYYGLIVSLLFFLNNNLKKTAFYLSALVLLSYMLIGTSLGVVFSLFIAIVIVYFKKIKFIVPLFLLLALTFYLILYIDIPIFIRIRNVVSFASNIPLKDYIDIKNTELYKYSEYDNSLTNIDGQSNNSFLFRIQHWIKIINDWWSSGFYHILFGLGDGYTVTKFNLEPHNDYLRLLTEYGLILFTMISRYLVLLYKKLKMTSVFYIISAALIYHFSENLVTFFPANCIFYFIIGYLYFNTKKNSMNSIPKRDKKLCNTNI